MHLPDSAHGMIWATKSWKKKKKTQTDSQCSCSLRGKQCYFLLFIQYLYLCVYPLLST